MKRYYPSSLPPARPTVSATRLQAAGHSWSSAFAAVAPGTLSLAFIVLGLLVACGSRRGETRQASTELRASLPNSALDVATPVAGQSWLEHLGLPLSQTHMGKMGGSAPAPASPRREPEGRYPEMLKQPFVLAGADLYRLNCQSCHGPEGKGSPPEINSLIGPVQGASAAMIEQRMKDRGAEISDEMAAEMAAEAQKSLLGRLHNGGKAMPPFNHLREDEIQALLVYLDQLAGVPAGHRSAAVVTESALRVGEHLVKGTCHVCHNATGPGGGHMAMMRGIIPSLASMPQEKSLGSVIDQVQNGSSGMMMMMRGPQMPALPYLTDQEIAAAYFYLETHPPKP